MTLREQTQEHERRTLSPLACLSAQSRGRQRQEQKIGCHSFFLYLYIYPFGAHYTVGDARGSRLVVYNDTCRSGCLSGYYREVRALGMLVIGIEKIPFWSCAPAKKRL